MATSLELQDVQQGILRKKNIDEANFEAAAGTTVAEYTEELIERAETSTQPVLIMFDAIIGKVPSSASLDVQAALAQAQFDDYAAKGVANPELGPYEALGRSLSSTAGFAAQSDGLEDGQFITNVYVKAFGVTPGTAQVDHFQDQITYFTNLYTGSGIPAAQAALQARGAVYGQIFGIAATVEDSPLDIAAENFLRGTVTGTAIYDAPLSASQPASPDPDVQTVDLTPNTDSGLAFSLGEGADTFNAQVQQTAFLPIQTLNSTDNLDGGADRDTLNAQLVNAFTVPAGLKGIEVLNIEGAPGFITPPVTLDVVNADSIDTIGFRSPTNNVTINNLKTALQEINISDETGGLTNTINHVAGALAGDDELNINLSNVGQGGGDVHLVLNGVDGYDTFNVSSAGGLPNEIDVKGTAQVASTVNITGDTDLNINGEPGNGWNTGPLDLLDASTFSGKLDTDFVGSGDVTVHGGTNDDDLTFWVTGGVVVANGNDGDDLIRLGVDDVFPANVTKATLSGGDGNDTLSSRSTGPVSLNGDDGDDELRFNENGGAVTFSADDAANGGEGDDLLVIEADNNGSVLLGAGVGAKITGIETIRHEATLVADMDLNVNMAETGSSNLVVLAGNGGPSVNNYDEVNVTNMTNAQTLEIRDDIEEDLNLNHAPGVIQFFNLNFVGGVTVDRVDDFNNNVVGEIDGYFISSTGGGTNTITDANLMTADVAVSGTSAFSLGTAGGARYDVNNSLITGNQPGNVFTGSLSVFAGDNHQTIVGGAGSDLIDGADGNDLINLVAGGNDIVVLRDDDNNITLATAATNATRIVNFSNDTLRFDISDLGLEEGDGTAVDVGDGVVMLDLAFGETEAAAGSNVNYVKLTTAVSGATDAQGLFNAAIGAGNISVTNFTSDLLVTAYDDTNDQMVVMKVDAGITQLDSGDGVEVIATVAMTLDQYNAFNGSNISFV